MLYVRTVMYPAATEPGYFSLQGTTDTDWASMINLVQSSKPGLQGH